MEETKRERKKWDKEERRREVEDSDNDRTYKKMISICWNIGKR